MLLLSQHYNFRNWTLEDGLPQSQINQIIQDHKGQLWLASRGGLSRFDGSSFYTFTKRKGLHSYKINSLFEDREEVLWIGLDRGVLAFNGTEFKDYSHGFGLPNAGIHDITEDSTGRIIMASDSGVFYFNEDRFQLLKGFPIQSYKTLHFAAPHLLWAGSTQNGLYRYDGKNVAHYHTGNSTLPSNSIQCLLQDDKGKLWIGTRKGLAQFSQQALTPFKLPPGLSELEIQALTKDPYGRIWIALLDNGLLQYDGKKTVHLTTKNGLKTNRILAIATDTDGNVWIGTNGHGLQQYQKPWFVHYANPEENAEWPKITALTKDKSGTIWLGTENGNIAFFKEEQLHWQQHLNWPDNIYLHHLQAIDKQTILASTNRGVWKVNATSPPVSPGKSGLPSGEVYQSLSDADGNVWFATAKGVYLESGNRITMPEVIGKPIVSAYTIFRDSKDQIWIGAVQGIYRYINGKLEEHPTLRNFDFGEVKAIAEDKKGALYFGGFNYGLLVMHIDSPSPQHITSAGGLPNEGISCLLVDTDGYLWIGTSKYLSKIPVEQFHKKEKLRFHTYSTEDGLQGIEISSNAIAQVSDGTIWFGTSKGLTKYIPSMERKNKVLPVLQLKDIKLFMQEPDWGKMGYNTDSASGLPVNLRLPYHQNHLSFDYNSINLTDPEQVRYRYRLKGYSDQWSRPTEQSYASFNALPPGTYTFQLLARNGDGYWTPSPLSYTFSITPPIWKREWFIGALLVLVGGIAVTVARLREKSLVKLNSLLEMKVQHRTQLLEEKNFEKEILLKEIHHRVKNNLQIVISMLNLQARQLQDEYTLDVMRSLRSRVRSMALLHERLYQHGDLSSIDLDDYFRGICESLYASYGITTKQVELALEVPSIKVDIDSAITLGLIVNELISNTLKYAFQGCTGILRIQLQHLEDNHYMLSVSDNGKGLPPEFADWKLNTFGLQLVTSLAKKLDGNVSFSSNNGTNSTLHFVLP